MAFTQERDAGLVDKLVTIKRVAKVVKGGRRFSFAAIVVVGDESGRVGWGTGKAKELPDAVRKATDSAKRTMVRVAMREGRTIHHDVNGRFGGSKIIMKPAKPGTGIIAGGPMRAVFEAMGMKDVVAKSLGSNNPFNLIQATFDAFGSMETPRSVAQKRGIRMADLRRGMPKAEAAAMEAAEEVKPAKKAAAKPAAKKAPAKKAPAKKAAPKKDAKPAVKAESKKDAVKAAAKTEAKAAKADA